MTMGALHEGHATLIRDGPAAARARHRHDLPQPAAVRAQARTCRATRGPSTPTWRSARRAGVDLVFAPTPDVIYPDGDPGVRVSAGPLGDVLEGQSRPGHFDGMLTVVGQAAAPDPRATSAYFGQKDAQQLLLIRRMVRDLDFPVDVVVGAHRARARRAGHEQPQHLPHRLRPRDRPVPVQALRAGAAAATEGPSAIRRAARDGARARAAGARSTTSSSSTRTRWRTCPSGTAARRCSPSPAGSAPRGSSTTCPSPSAPAAGPCEVFSDADV